MDYGTASVEEIATHFEGISRQRISQLLVQYRERELHELVDKIEKAKVILKERKFIAKNGCTLAVAKRAKMMWDAMHDRVANGLAYVGCTINFGTEADFRRWVIKQIGFSEQGFELDKDILIKGNRVYSPETCVFVPREINSLFSNCYDSRKRGQYPLGVSYNKGSKTFVAQMSKNSTSKDKYLGSFKTAEEAFQCYKLAKEAKIKRLAEKWKDRIDPRAYKAMMERTVDIDD